MTSYFMFVYHDGNYKCMNVLLGCDDKGGSTNDCDHLVESPLFNSIRAHLDKWYPAVSKEAELERARNNESGGLNNVP